VARTLLSAALDFDLSLFADFIPTGCIREQEGPRYTALGFHHFRVHPVKRVHALLLLHAVTPALVAT